MKIDFTKMNGLGNDFVIIDARHQSVNLNQDQIIKLADRNNSITKGCDQVIVLEPSKKADVFMRIYNTDGSQAQSCGNATRCVAALLIDGMEEAIFIETIERVLSCSYFDEEIYAILVDMGKALSLEKIDLGSEYAELGQAISVNVGNPHCIFFIDDAEKITDEYLAHWGPKIETHPKFPERTNVEFVSKSVYGGICFRVWERGVGITKACGSGAMAVAWTIYKCREDHPKQMHIDMDGGSVIVQIENNESILMIGSTRYEFKDSVEV